MVSRDPPRPPPKPPKVLLPKVVDAPIWPKGDVPPLEELLPPSKMDLVEDDNANDFVGEELANEDSVWFAPAFKNGDAWVEKLDMPELLKADAVVLLLFFSRGSSPWVSVNLSDVDLSAVDLPLFSVEDIVVSLDVGDVCVGMVSLERVPRNRGL